MNPEGKRHGDISRKVTGTGNDAASNHASGEGYLDGRLLVAMPVLHVARPGWGSKLDPLQATSDLISGVVGTARPAATLVGWFSWASPELAASSESTNAPVVVNFCTRFCVRSATYTPAADAATPRGFWNCPSPAPCGTRATTGG